MFKAKFHVFSEIPIFILLLIINLLISQAGATRAYCNAGEIQNKKITPLYRLWSDKEKDHMLTARSKEKDILQKTMQWNYEGIEGYVYETQQPDTIPLYRYYNPTTKDHCCTTRAKFKMPESNSSYNYDGIIGYIYKIPHPNTVPLYQFYSPVRQDCFVTTDFHFLKYAKQFGYNSEGIEGFVLKTEESQ